MDKAMFATLMKPCARYYNRTLEDEDLKFYFEELGGETEKRLAKAIRDHMANSRFWPKVADLKKRLGHQMDASSAGSGLSKAEEHTHWYVAERMLEAKIEGRSFRTDLTTLIHVEPLVDKAYQDYESYKPAAHLSESGQERSRRSYAFGKLNVLLRNALSEAA